MLNLNDNKKILTDKIKIKDVMLALNVSDIRTAVSWCKAKSILILKFGKEMYINLIDFELAVDRPFIESLKIKYPENWKELYSAYKKGDYLTIAEKVLQGAPLTKTKFIAPGLSGNNFIKRITKKTQ